jgi:hypothetical protein
MGKIGAGISREFLVLSENLAPRFREFSVAVQPRGTSGKKSRTVWIK